MANWSNGTVSINQYYDEIQPLYRNFTTKVGELVDHLMRENGINFHSVTSRTKYVNSLRRKINR